MAIHSAPTIDADLELRLRGWREQSFNRPKAGQTSCRMTANGVSRSQLGRLRLPRGHLRPSLSGTRHPRLIQSSSASMPRRRRFSRGGDGSIGCWRFTVAFEAFSLGDSIRSALPSSFGRFNRLRRPSAPHRYRSLRSAPDGPLLLSILESIEFHSQLAAHNSPLLPRFLASFFD